MPEAADQMTVIQLMGKRRRKKNSHYSAHRPEPAIKNVGVIPPASQRPATAQGPPADFDFYRLPAAVPPPSFFGNLSETPAPRSLHCSPSRFLPNALQPPDHPITGIPLDAYDHVVNSKPTLEWVMERQSVATDKASVITNDANL